jgi:aspartyl protease family protein
MLRFTLIALAGAVAAVGAAHAVTTLAPESGHEASEPQLRASAEAPVAEPIVQPASISKASDGHFWAEAEVNGERVRFLVDTGATAVALTAADAQRLGFAPRNWTTPIRSPPRAARPAPPRSSSPASRSPGPASPTSKPW